MTEQETWDAYRMDVYRDMLVEAGVGGPDDLEAALDSKFLLNEDDPEDIKESGPLYLGEHVLHTLAVFASKHRGRGFAKTVSFLRDGRYLWLEPAGDKFMMIHTGKSNFQLSRAEILELSDALRAHAQGMVDGPRMTETAR